MAVRYEITNEGSYARRIEVLAGESEGALLRRIFPPEVPKGYEFKYRWLDRQRVEYGVFPTAATVPAVPVAPLKAKAATAVLSAAKLSERATELGIDVKGKTPEQLRAAVDEMEAMEVATR